MQTIINTSILSKQSLFNENFQGTTIQLLNMSVSFALFQVKTGVMFNFIKSVYYKTFIDTIEDDTNIHPKKPLIIKVLLNRYYAGLQSYHIDMHVFELI